MNVPRPAQIYRDFYFDLAPDPFPTLRGRDAIPVGTVAARIMELHNLAKVSTSNVSPSPISRRPENSHVGYGSRVDSRFGKPASRSSKPAEDTQADIRHTFLGLNIQRSNHMEEHAFVDQGPKCNRAAGLHERLQPSGSGGLIEYQSMNSQDTLAGSDSHVESQSSNMKETERMKDNCSESQIGNVAPRSSLPNVSRHVPPPTSIKKEEPFKSSPEESTQDKAANKQKMSTGFESRSLETGSVLRRESVRGLYYYHDIQRPVGLVMSQNISLGSKDMPRSLEEHEPYHVCSYALANSSMNCKSGCFCEKCEGPSPAAIAASDGSVDCVENKPKCKDEHLQNEKAIVEEDRLYSAEGSNSVRKLPLLRFQEATPCCGSRESSRKDTQLSDISRIYQQGVTTEVLGFSKITPPFHEGDAILSSRTSNVMTVNTHSSELKIQDLNHRPQEGDHSRGLHSNSSSKDDRGSGDDSCGSSGCHATHQGYLPYRHSITCIRKRRRCPRETDSGYFASTSHLEEPEISRSKIDLSPNYGNWKHEHHTPSIHQPSPNQNEFAHLQDETKICEFDHSFHQTSHTGGITCFLSASNCAKSLWGCQEKMCPNIERGTTLNSAIAPTLDKSQFHDLEEKMKEEQRNLEAVDNECDYKEIVNKHQIRRRIAEIGPASSHCHHKHTHTRQCISPQSMIPNFLNVEVAMMRSESPSKLILPYLKATLSGARVDTKTEGSVFLAGDTTVPSRDNTEQEMPTIIKSQLEPMNQDEFRGQFEGKPAQLRSSPTKSLNQVSSTTPDSSTEAITQNQQEALIAGSAATAEVGQSVQHASPCADLTTDMARLIPVHTSGDISPSRFKPTSRRLSAFFKLQEQNAVSLLNKRLQDHQEALRRAEDISNDQVSADIRCLSLDQRPANYLNIERREPRLESIIANTTEKQGHTQSVLTPQLGQQWDKDEGLGIKTYDQKERLNSSFKLGHMMEEEQEHGRAWKQSVTKKKFGIAQNPNLESENERTIAEERVVDDFGINGITIVIHLEGRENVIIKADLSKGI